MAARQSIGGDLAAALDAVSVPTHIVDPSGIVRWQNAASRRLVGDVCGRHYTTVVAPEDVRRARERFTRAVASGRVRDQEMTAIGADGGRLKVELSSVPLRDGHHLVGIFGQAVSVERDEPTPPLPELTPRQVEVLGLLERGHSTHQIASELHLSIETVRNHVARILRALDVHTRLEAVVVSQSRSGRINEHG
jgi:PAS domain S-box-containing protein